MTAINSAIVDISEHFPTNFTNTGDTWGDTWTVKAKWLFNKKQQNLNTTLGISREYIKSDNYTRNKEKL